MLDYTGILNVKNAKLYHGIRTVNIQCKSINEWSKKNEKMNTVFDFL